MEIENIKGLKKFLDDDIMKLQIRQSYDNYKLKLQNNTRLLETNRRLYERLLKKRIQYATQLGEEIKRIEEENKTSLAV